MSVDYRITAPHVEITWHYKNRLFNEAIQKERQGETKMSEPETFEAEPYRPKSSKETGTKRYRYMALEECKLLRRGSRVDAVGLDGKIYNLQVNGQPQVWKTRPLDVRVPLKYGMYKCSNAWYKGGVPSETRVVVEVSELTKLVI